MADKHPPQGSPRPDDVYQDQVPTCAQPQDMTYVKQLEDYEEAVMAKRLAEMPAAELDRLLAEVK